MNKSSIVLMQSGRLLRAVRVHRGFFRPHVFGFANDKIAMNKICTRYTSVPTTSCGNNGYALRVARRMAQPKSAFMYSPVVGVGIGRGSKLSA